MVDMVPVVSANVTEVGYDPDTSTLYVQFDNGLYQYAGVSEQEFIGLRDAPSVGSYLHGYIKPRYRGVKVGGGWD